MKEYKAIIRFGGYSDVEYTIRAKNKKRALNIAKGREWADGVGKNYEEGKITEHEYKEVIWLKEEKNGS